MCIRDSIDAGIRAVLVLSAEFTAAIVTAMLVAGKPLLGLSLIHI